MTNRYYKGRFDDFWDFDPDSAYKFNKKEEIIKVFNRDDQNDSYYPNSDESSPYEIIEVLTRN